MTIAASINTGLIGPGICGNITVMADQLKVVTGAATAVLDANLVRGMLDLVQPDPIK